MTWLAPIVDGRGSGAVASGLGREVAAEAATLSALSHRLVRRIAYDWEVRAMTRPIGGW